MNKNNKDLNEIAKYEKAIKEKYGTEAIQNPKKNWNEDKEEAYLQDLKIFYASKKQEDEKVKQQMEGFEVVSKKRQNRSNRICKTCSSFSVDLRDDLYMSKFDCCFSCYIQYVEDREERWKSGWRPNK